MRHDQEPGFAGAAGRNVVAYKTDSGTRFFGRWLPIGASYQRDTSALLGEFPTWERCVFFDLVRNVKGEIVGLSFRARLVPEKDGTFVVSQEPGERPFDDLFDSLTGDEMQALGSAIVVER